MTGHNPLINDFAVIGTNNRDCEEIVIGEEGICNAGPVAGKTFYQTKKPKVTQALPNGAAPLCSNGQASTPVFVPGTSTVDATRPGAYITTPGKRTWTCQSSAPSPASCTASLIYCGDGIANDTSEQCDDGNTNNNDACNNRCKTVGFGSTEWCGDFITQNPNTA
jgi:cysteine-rich repeat protein